jgi:hypothetical protein
MRPKNEREREREFKLDAAKSELKLVFIISP